MTIKECCYREVLYALCPGVLDGLLDPELVKLDMRGDMPARTAANYPWLVFSRRRMTLTSAGIMREDIDMALIGLQGSETRSDAFLEQIDAILINHFAFKLKTWGKFTEDGTADPTGGIKARCSFQSLEEAFDGNAEEKMHILSFAFTHIR